MDVSCVSSSMLGDDVREIQSCTREDAHPTHQFDDVS